MDVKPGHCWRCEKTLPVRSVSCDLCPKAVYCCDKCKLRDKIRHGAVECKMFGPESCTHCKKTGNLKQCSACNDAWYCDAACQRKNWTAHRPFCQTLIEALVPGMTRRHTDHAQVSASIARSLLSNPIYFFGNTMAYDFLRLEDNEWAELKPGDEASEVELSRDYHILSAGCGSLRNTVMTTASLPAEYKGKLHITLNDMDPLVMARNVLFLFMLGKYAHDDRLASSLATIWYSVNILEDDYHLIHTSLQSLLEVTSKSLTDLLGGLVVVSVEDLAMLRDVWVRWLHCHLPCERKHIFSINLSQQRQENIEADENLYRDRQIFLGRQSSTEAESVKKWFQSGLFTPDEWKQKDLTFDNPTLAAPYKEISTPLEAWDSLLVKEYAKERPSCSVMAMYHAYVTHLLEKSKSLFIPKRLHITILLSNCIEIPQRHQTLKLDTYDRIFTSNLTDYIGIRKLLKTLKPLLNVTNKKATIVTETMIWWRHITELPQDLNCVFRQNIDESNDKATELYQQDTGKEVQSENGYEEREYRYNIPLFIAYLRAHMMAGSHLIPSLDRIPSFKEAMQCEGLQMRDFRKELNKLVPFQYRMSARRLTHLSCDERAIEWYILPANDV